MGGGTSGGVLSEAYTCRGQPGSETSKAQIANEGEQGGALRRGIGGERSIAYKTQKESLSGKRRKAGSPSLIALS